MEITFWAGDQDEADKIFQEISEDLFFRAEVMNLAGLDRPTRVSDPTNA
jgi:hypothetical protein